ncbi:MAG: chromosome segregation protein [Tenericutes bacterium ADurb.BinA124]|nr:MAG: chromosome segregation protein [Tenericutes bacterium ADurb.BinA124]
MEIKIKKMTIENFKKIKKFELEFPEDLKIYGRNATGKTTLLDAFTWCLFEKDSLGATKFNWKPLNKDGTEMHNLDTSVEVILCVDGTERSYKRLVREVYTKKRGEAEATFAGHETVCSIDGIDKSVGDYKKAINDLIKEDLFRMLTTVTYFTSLNWDKQREIIFSLVTSVSDKEIAVDNPEFERLLDYLNKGITVADLLKQTKLEKQKLNVQANDLATRISTLNNMSFNLPDGYNNADAEMELKRCYTRQREIAAMPKKGKQLELEDTVYTIESKIRELQNEKATSIAKAKQEHELRVSELAAKARQLGLELARLDEEKSSTRLRIKHAEEQIAAHKTKKEGLYAKYDEINAKKFAEGNCAFCGQPLPADKRKEAEDRFNLAKAEELETVVNDGKIINQLVNDLEKTIATLTAQQETASDTAKKRTEELYQAQQEVNKITESASVLDTAKLDAEIEKQQERLNTVKRVSDKQDNREDPFKDELNRLENEVKRLNEQIAEYKQSVNNAARVEDFKSDLQRVNVASAANETLQTLCEKFLAHKAGFLETKINAYFGIVKFQLFQTQINGGITETCVATVDGVPFPSINSAAKINAGLDIIKTLQMIYGVKAPIWIDNAESVTDILVLPCQMIKLYVTDDDRVMRFEGGIDWMVDNIIKSEEKIEKEERL